MARLVKVNHSTLDDVVHVSLGVWVHRHLICDASERLQNLVAQYDRKLEASAHKTERKAVSNNRVAVLPRPFDDKRALELWTSFLYGQPIWGDPDDFEALIEIHNFAKRWRHLDAMDASVDAMRDIVCNHSEVLTDPFTKLFEFFDSDTGFPVKLLMDYVAYGKDAQKARSWVKDYIYGENQHERREPLGNDLCDMFLVKAKEESAGQAPPDLMARCKYHAHTEHGLPCYLDK